MCLVQQRAEELVDLMSSTMDNGGQCVRTALVQMMQEWLVVSWGTQVTHFMEL